jgi:hypothetical protein
MFLSKPTRAEKPAKDITDNNKGKKAQAPSPVIKVPVPEVKEILKPPPFFNFDHEIQKIRIPVPLSELVKHEDFKRSLSKLL